MGFDEANQIRFAAISHDVTESSRPRVAHDNGNRNNNKKDGNECSLLMGNFNATTAAG